MKNTLYKVQGACFSSHVHPYIRKSRKRALDSEDSATEAKRGRAEKPDEDEEMVEEKLRQLKQLAEGTSTQQSPSKASASAPPACLNSHWQQIGNLMLYTAAGVTARAKVRNTQSSRSDNPINLHVMVRFL